MFDFGREDWIRDESHGADGKWRWLLVLSLACALFGMILAVSG